MRLLLWCDRVYDSTEYSRCPYCSGELEEEHGERYFKICLNCDGTMYWDGTWKCTNCYEEINTSDMIMMVLLNIK